MSEMFHSAADAVAGAEALIALKTAFRANWPAIKVRIADRADAMLTCYSQIAEGVRERGVLSPEQDDILTKALVAGREIVALLRLDLKPAVGWDAVVNLLADALNTISRTLGMAATTVTLPPPSQSDAEAAQSAIEAERAERGVLLELAAEMRAGAAYARAKAAMLRALADISVDPEARAEAAQSAIEAERVHPFSEMAAQARLRSAAAYAEAARLRAMLGLPEEGPGPETGGTQ